MARRLSGGLVGQPSVGAINIAPTAVITAAENQDITLSPEGSGTVVFTNNAILNSQNDLRFADADSSNWVAFQATSVIASNVTWTLPGTDGTSGQALSTNGSGTLSWQTPFISVSNNTSDSGTNYIEFTTATSGTVTATRVSSTGLTFQPSTATVSTGQLALNGNVASSSTTTGTIRVTGGIGLSGNITAGGSFTDSKGEIRAIPVNGQAGAYTLVAVDHGRLIRAGSTVTVPANIFSEGQNISVYNNTAGNITISQGASVTLRQVGTANTGNRTLAQRGFVAIVCVATNEFVISGSGLT
jgi:hypothetical protein